MSLCEVIEPLPPEDLGKSKGGAHGGKVGQHWRGFRLVIAYGLAPEIGWCHGVGGL